MDGWTHGRMDRQNLLYRNAEKEKDGKSNGKKKKKEMGKKEEKEMGKRRKKNWEKRKEMKWGGKNSRPSTIYGQQ